MFPFLHRIFYCSGEGCSARAIRDASNEAKDLVLETAHIDHPRIPNLERKRQMHVELQAAAAAAPKSSGIAQIYDTVARK